MSIDDLYTAPPKPPLYCSFCGKSEHEVVKLIAGPTSFICDECVDLCSELVHGKSVLDRLSRLERWAWGSKPPAWLGKAA